MPASRSSFRRTDTAACSPILMPLSKMQTRTCDGVRYGVLFNVEQVMKETKNSR
jgi:hypothetical protein